MGVDLLMCYMIFGWFWAGESKASICATDASNNTKVKTKRKSKMTKAIPNLKYTKRKSYVRDKVSPVSTGAPNESQRGGKGKL